jgi:hypothetical protein
VGIYPFDLGCLLEILVYCVLLGDFVATLFQEGGTLVVLLGIPFADCAAGEGTCE